MNSSLTSRLKEYAQEQGIDLIGITSAEPFIIKKEKEEIVDPKEILNDAKAIIVTGFYMYKEENDNLIIDGSDKLKGRYNAYNVKAFMPMLYHHIRIINSFVKEEGFRLRFDGGKRIPFKMAAVRAGLGKYGKNSVVITEKFGSFVMFLPLVTNAPLDYDEFPIYESDCGKCEICIKSCPTGAIYAQFKLNRNLCITHWLWGNFVPVHLREHQENRLFGCGECLKACPKNRKLKFRDSFPVKLEDVADNPELISLVTANEEYFKEIIPSFPLLAGLEAIRGNAIIALGNIADKTSIDALGKSLKYNDAIIRSYSAWALGRIGGVKVKNILKKALLTEKKHNVIYEIKCALANDIN